MYTPSYIIALLIVYQLVQKCCLFDHFSARLCYRWLKLNFFWTYQAQGLRTWKGPKTAQNHKFPSPMIHDLIVSGVYSSYMYTLTCLCQYRSIRGLNQIWGAQNRFKREGLTLEITNICASLSFIFGPYHDKSLDLGLHGF